jgi:hypothetical protein
MKTTKISKETDKEIKAYLKECSKLKGAALREAYAEIIGRDTNETSRERLLNGIARILYHNAEQGLVVPHFELPKKEAKAETKPETKPEAKGKRKSATATDGAGSVASSGSNDAGDVAAAGAAGGDAAGGDNGAGPGSDPANRPLNANAGASSGATADGADGGEKRRAMRARGERDSRLPPAGTVLERKYKDVTYKVTLRQDNGCLYNGKPYKSLSGFVKDVTGTNHNGLLWFGLIKRESKAKAPEMIASGAQAE